MGCNDSKLGMLVVAGTRPWKGRASCPPAAVKAGEPACSSRSSTRATGEFARQLDQSPGPETSCLPVSLVGGPFHAIGPLLLRRNAHYSQRMKRREKSAKSARSTSRSWSMSAMANSTEEQPAGRTKSPGPLTQNPMTL